MSPGRYTELFFLDEAVAFAAGHRPCAECRWQWYKSFRAAWMRQTKEHCSDFVRASEIDAELHRARIDKRGGKVTHKANLDTLPNGCFVEIDNEAYLAWDDALALWTPERYARKDRRSFGVIVTVLTPQPIVECFRQGYQPQTHASLREL